MLRKWLFFVCLTAFSIYWFVNLILWFPWSYSPTLGITLMLTVSPLVWAFAIYQCLETYPGIKKLNGAAITALCYILIAVIADYIFFGLIRHAIKDLYRPTTFYGYGFLVSLPFIVLLLFQKRLKAPKAIKTPVLVGYNILGVLSFIIILAVIKLHIAA
jgi:hypothetical protein